MYVTTTGLNPGILTGHGNDLVLVIGRFARCYRSYTAPYRNNSHFGRHKVLFIDMSGIMLLSE